MNTSRKTSENRAIFQTILDVFGGEDEKCPVQTYWDASREHWIDIAACPGSPVAGVVSYATIALSDFSIGKMVGDIPLGVEIVGACYDRYPDFPGILSSCAFNIIIEEATCFPGVIYPDMIEPYYPDAAMKHILFVPAFGWKKEFQTLGFPTKKAAWLMAVPISEAEYQYAKEQGVEELETLFEEKRIDVYDVGRVSIL